MQGTYDFLSSHAIMSFQAGKDIKKFCNFSRDLDKQNSKCNAAFDEYFKDVDFIDEYNIYAPLCKNSSLTSQPKENSVRFKLEHLLFFFKLLIMKY